MNNELKKTASCRMAVETEGQASRAKFKRASSRFGTRRARGLMGGRKLTQPIAPQIPGSRTAFDHSCCLLISLALLLPNISQLR